MIKNITKSTYQYEINFIEFDYGLYNSHSLDY
jgi:hypothetical protein